MNAQLAALAAMTMMALGAGTAADAQVWGPPPPPPPYGYPPGPPPPYAPGSPQVVQRWHWGQPGYHRYHPRCWIEYRNGGWEMVKVCQ